MVINPIIIILYQLCYLYMCSFGQGGNQYTSMVFLWCSVLGTPMIPHDCPIDDPTMEMLWALQNQDCHHLCNRLDLKIWGLGW